MRWIFLFLVGFFAVDATAEPICPGGSAVAHFKLQVRRTGETIALPLESLNTLRQGDEVIYVPSDPSPGEDLRGAEVVLLLATREGGELMVLERKPAIGRQQWTMPRDVGVVALAYGPSGLRADRVQALVRKDPEMLAQLAEYGERTTQVETLVAALGRPNESQNMEAALRGFATGASSGARLDRNATLDQQTLTMLRALNPALASYDPLAAEPRIRWQQSAGLASAVAGLFFGNTVAVAATSATLFLNLRSVAFPRTELRSALRRDTGLCAKRESRSGARFAYLWARRMPQGEAPKLALGPDSHLAEGIPVRLPLSGDSGGLSRVRNWRWVDAQGQSIAANGVYAEGALQLRTPPPAGRYTLLGDWDWQPVRAAETVSVHRQPDLTGVRLTDASADALGAGQGRVRLRLTGTDFQFVTHFELESISDRLAERVAARFAPMVGPSAEVEIEVDTSVLRPGPHWLWVKRVDGQRHRIAVMVHDERPELSGLPWTVRLGGQPQRLRLSGTRLDEIERLEFAGGTIAWDREQQVATVEVNAQTRPGTTWELTARVAGRNLPLRWPQGVRVIPPAVTVLSMERAKPEEGSVALDKSEIEAGTPISVAVKLSAALTEPPRQVRCGTLERAEMLRETEWFLVIRPEAKGGCVTVVELEPGGAEVTIGNAIRRPELTTFTLSSEPAGPGQFWGELAGRGLERIERVGWNAQEGTPISGLPTGEADRQRLRIAMPWPAPAPHAPLYVWLRGESIGRRTNVRY